MATISITKDFKVNDIDAYQKMLEQLEKAPNRKISASNPAVQELKRGREKLKQFSFR